MREFEIGLTGDYVVKIARVGGREVGDGKIIISVIEKNGGFLGKAYSDITHIINDLDITAEEAIGMPESEWYKELCKELERLKTRFLRMEAVLGRVESEIEIEDKTI